MAILRRQPSKPEVVTHAQHDRPTDRPSSKNAQQPALAAKTIRTLRRTRVHDSRNSTLRRPNKKTSYIPLSLRPSSLALRVLISVLATQSGLVTSTYRRPHNQQGTHNQSVPPTHFQRAGGDVHIPLSKPRNSLFVGFEHQGEIDYSR